MTELKALHVITGRGVGSAEQQLRLLLRHLPVDCDVVTLTNPGTVGRGWRRRTASASFTSAWPATTTRSPCPAWST